MASLLCKKISLFLAYLHCIALHLHSVHLPHTLVVDADFYFNPNLLSWLLITVVW